MDLVSCQAAFERLTNSREVVPRLVEVRWWSLPGPCRFGVVRDSTKDAQQRGITVKKKVPVVQVTTPEAASELPVCRSRRRSEVVPGSVEVRW